MLRVFAVVPADSCESRPVNVEVNQQLCHYQEDSVASLISGVWWILQQSKCPLPDSNVRLKHFLEDNVRQWNKPSCPTVTGTLCLIVIFWPRLFISRRVSLLSLHCGTVEDGAASHPCSEPPQLGPSQDIPVGPIDNRSTTLKWGGHDSWLRGEKTLLKRGLNSSAFENPRFNLS